MARRPHEPDAPRRGFDHAGWHDWWICRACGAVVARWEQHVPCPKAELDELEAQREQEHSYDLAGAADKARAEGGAVAEAGMWRGGLRQIAAMMGTDWRAVRRLVAHRRARAAVAAVPELDPPARTAADAARQDAWQRMAPMINRTTGGT